MQGGEATGVEGVDEGVGVEVVEVGGGLHVGGFVLFQGGGGGAVEDCVEGFAVADVFGGGGGGGGGGFFPGGFGGVEFLLGLCVP